jgi:hypothetical protein
VTVITPGGTSAISAADQFTYVVGSPKVVSLLRFGFHDQPTSLVLTFSSALDATLAQNVNNYQIVTLGGPGKFGNLIGHVTLVSAAVYDPATFTVTLFPVQKLDIHNFYQLTVNGTTPGGLTGVTGVPLAGQGGVPGTNYVAEISIDTLAGPAPATLRAARHPKSNAPAHFPGRSGSGKNKVVASHPVKAQPVKVSLPTSKTTTQSKLSKVKVDRPAATRSTTPMSMADWYKVREQMMKIAARAQGLG